MENLLIKNTTIQQRKEIILSGLAFAGLENDSLVTAEDFNDYINGYKELEEIYNDILRSNYEKNDKWTGKNSKQFDLQK